jgi:hypothetical protein
MNMGWTEQYGSPMGDLHKYQVMSNGEIDFWQISVDNMANVPPQTYRDPWTGQISSKAWCTGNASPNASDIADGYDTRYLISWGPSGFSITLIRMDSRSTV